MKTPFALITCLFVLVLPAQAFERRVYREITEEVVSTASFPVDFTGNITFSDRAQREIVQAISRLDRSIAGLRRINNDWHFYDERFEDATERLTLLKELIVTASTGSAPDPPLAREIFGKALNTLQDFYSHTNYVELGNTEIETKLGRELMEDADPELVMCSGGSLADAGLTTLTSGYRNCRQAPEGKCCRDDLDKEDASVDGFETARTLAKAATEDYLAQVVADLRALDDNEAALRRFVDRDTAVIFVIDTTESMREELVGIKSSAASILGQFNNTQTGRYILIPFEDGENPIRSVFTTPDPQEFLDAVNALEADSFGGGDCREAGWDAVDRAIEEAARKSTIYFWSDAWQRGRIRFIGFLTRPLLRIRAALFKRTRFRLVLTGRCIPIGTSYDGFKQFASAVGGKVYETDPDKVGDIVFDDENIFDDSN